MRSGDNDEEVWKERKVVVLVVYCAVQWCLCEARLDAKMALDAIA